MKKYKFTGETKERMGATLHRIRAGKDFGVYESNDLGGWIEKEKNLSHNGNAWVSDDACVYDNACVCGSAWVCENACIYGNAYVSGDACVSENAWVCDSAHVFGNAWIHDDARISGCAHVFVNACVYENAHVSENAHISGNARIFDNAQISGDVDIFGNAHIGKNAVVTCNNDWFAVDNVGSRNDTVTFYKGTDGIYVCTGCFNDSLDKFIQAVKDKHGDNYFAKEYILCIELAKYKLKGE